MKVEKTFFCLFFLLTCILSVSFGAYGEENVPPSSSSGSEKVYQDGKSLCNDLSAELQKQNEELHREIRQLKREILMLRQEITRPDVRDIIGGIGFVFGLCGVGFYFHTRWILRRKE